MMTPKRSIKIGVDLLMTGLLLFLMAFMLTGQALHEWLGAGMLALFILHHILNLRWIRRMGQGRYTPFRSLQTALALLVLAAMLGAMVSGVWMSRYVFAFLPLRGGMSLARTAHMLCVYWGFIVLSAHLGLHWGMVLGMARKAAGVKPGSRSRTLALRILTLGVAAYGVYAFCKHRMADYLFLRSMFVFFDFEQPPLQFFAEHLAMMVLWAAISYYLGRAAQTWASARSVPPAKQKEGTS